MKIADQLFIAYNGIAPSAERMAPIGSGYGQFLLKPSGGIWTSPLIGIKESAFTRSIPRSRHEHWLGKLSRRYLMVPHQDANLYVLDRKQDLLALASTPFSLRKFEQKGAVTNPLIAKMYCESPSPIDWGTISGGYDGVWARGFIPPAWSCESIVWFQWLFNCIVEVT